MRRIWLLLVLLLAAAVPTAVFAARTVHEFTYTIEDFGQVEVSPQRNQWVVTTNALHGWGTVCGLAVCDEGIPVEVEQKLRIVIEFTSAGVRLKAGASEVLMESVDLAADPPVWDPAGIITSGRRGGVVCVGDDANPCDTLEIRLSQRGSVRDGDTGQRLGRADLEITGILQRTGPGSAEWTSLEGVGTLLVR